MPELPDVENIKNYCDETILNKRIEKVSVKAKRLLEASENTLREHLLGNRFENSFRHGKYLFLSLSDGYNLILHFGMSGSVAYYKDEQPEYSKMITEFNNGYHFAYISVRKLGTIDVIKEKDKFIRNKNLGPDALDVNFKGFKDAIKNRRSYVKSALMKQQIIAGIGNVYSDEVLFQTGIHPKVKINELSESQLKDLFKNIQEILKKGVEVGAEPDTREFPRDFIIHHRNRNAKCPVCGGEIKRIKLSGRSSYFCPRCQKK